MIREKKCSKFCWSGSEGCQMKFVVSFQDQNAYLSQNDIRSYRHKGLARNSLLIRVLEALLISYANDAQDWVRKSLTNLMSYFKYAKNMLNYGK